MRANLTWLMLLALLSVCVVLVAGGQEGGKPDLKKEGEVVDDKGKGGKKEEKPGSKEEKVGKDKKEEKKDDVKKEEPKLTLKNFQGK